MSDANQAILYVRHNEGGFADNPLDRGGATNGGISLKFYQQFCDPHATVRTIQELSDSSINNLYHDLFWLKLPYAKIENQHICNYIFDMVVALGEFHGIQIAQRALWASNRRMSPADDGVLGSLTVEEINNASTAYLPCLMASRAAYYRCVVATHPNQQVFLTDWLKRSFEL